MHVGHFLSRASVFVGGKSVPFRGHNRDRYESVLHAAQNAVTL
jgi:hypothetical protein